MYSRGLTAKKGDGNDFSFTEDRRMGTSYFFTMRGRVTMSEASHVEYILNKALGAGCTYLVINMCFVKIFTSAGIRVILATYKKLRRIGGTLKIENPSETVRNVIGMTALDELLMK
ncbi:MAG: STAS domain-containing protein [Lachnospiraceae bacterium]|jgi:anti-anti-sigma factor|nr:STAS domain-containing protein [Lachnospiraceae bacterium]